MAVTMPDRSRGKPGETVQGLDALRTMLDTAGRLVSTLARDPLLGRLLAAFQAIPAAEREAIVAIIERDVAMRRADMDGSGTLIGMHNVRPNPNARLYVRVMESDAGDVPFLSFEELIGAVTRAARVMHRVMVTTPTANETWKDKVLATFEQLPPEELESIAWCLRHGIGLIDALAAKRAGEAQ
jgi:hypothetical protein